MRDAAVGFQCPECLKEGSRTTRSGRTAYGGLRPGNAAITSMVLIGLNALVWLAIVSSGGSRSRLVDILSLRPNGLCVLPGGGGYEISQQVCQQAAGGGRFLPGVVDGAYWQLLTSTFTHVEIWHIGFNMLALWVLGPQLELALGRVRFLALYLLSALTGSVAVYWFSATNSSTVGASGAIFGLMGALLVIAYKVRGDVQQILIWIGINAVLTFTVSDISWQGHLGGFLGGVVIAGLLAYAPRERRTVIQVAGLAIAVILVYAPRKKRSTIQIGGLVLIGVLLLAAIAARTATLS
jgi:membrane associated rhomboid family serine protease